MEIEVHARASRKFATPISRPVWMGVGIEDPSGVVETQVHWPGTLEKISTYISPLIHMCTCTVALFYTLFVPFSLQAETSPVTFTKNMKKTHPASMWPHAMAMKGTHSQPGHAKRPGVHTQAAEMAESATPLPLKTPSTEGVTGQRHPLPFTLEYFNV